MGTGKGTDLKKQRRAQTHADTGTASQARANGDCRSKGVDGSGALWRTQGEEEV